MANEADHGMHDDAERRDFLKILFRSAAVVGAGAVAWAFGEALGGGGGSAPPADNGLLDRLR
ncbi:MAG: ubiquinol-cytochrome c reductase iron-sulfur subunit N-terminal domain-containing protein [Acidiphilium sp.]